MFARIAGLAGLLTLSAIAWAMTPAAASAGDADQVEPAYRTVYQIDLQDTEGRHRTIDRIVALDDGGALVVKGWRGLRRTNQNRIDYSSVPIAGRLSQHRFDKEDLAPAHRVGEVRADGSTMALLLDPGADVPRDAVTRLAVLNQAYAYETRLPVKPGDWGDGGVERENWEGRGRQVGEVYWTGAGELMALVRPFVVTDSALW